MCVFESDNAVTNLELEDNALQAEGTRYLMEMLQTNISIQSLVSNFSKTVTLNTSVLQTLVQHGTHLL